jgi:hypothetical protein
MQPTLPPLRGSVWKFGPNSLAVSFGSSGRVLVDPGPAYVSSSLNAALVVPGDLSSRLFVGGYATDGFTQSMFVACLFASNGSLDTSWGTRGRLIVADLPGSSGYIKVRRGQCNHT